MSINDRLRDLRLSKNLNKRELADALGIKYTTYNNWEVGTREPGASHLIMFAKFYGVTIDYLLGHDEPVISEEKILDLAASGIGHDEKLTQAERERIKMAIKIALQK